MIANQNPMSLCIAIRKKLKKQLTDFEYQHYLAVMIEFVRESRHGYHLEKLHRSSANSALWSIRDNDKVRLIIQPKCRENLSFWCLIDVLFDHNYDRAFKAHENDDDCSQDYDIIELSEDQVETKELSSEKPLILESVDWYNKQYIVLGEEHLQAKKTLMPFAISGSPGSGKTLTSQSLVKDKVRSYYQDKILNPRILCVTRSKKLAENMQMQWQDAVTMEPELGHYCPFFKTLEDLFIEEKNDLSLQSNASGKEEDDSDKDLAQSLCGFSDFLNWINKLDFKKKSKPSTLTFHNADPHLIYQEFLNCSGYDSFAVYNKQVGSKRTLFTDELERRNIWSLYHQYLDHLKASNRTDLNFYKLKLKPYDLIVVDEAQIFSSLSLGNLIQLAKDYSIVFCFGPHQDQFGTTCKIPFINSFLAHFGNSKKDVSLTHYPLTASYRCSQTVVDFANAILCLKAYAIGGASHFTKYEIRSFYSLKEDTQGQIFWLNKDKLSEVINAEKAHHSFAIITQARYKKEAKHVAKILGKKRVFLVNDCRGLEYDHVLLYRLFDDERYLPVDKFYAGCLNLKWEEVPKKTAGSIIHNSVFNDAFTAITRARNVLYIFEPETQNQPRNLIAALKSLTQRLNKDYAKPDIIEAPIISSMDEWNKQCELLVQQNLPHHAKALKRHAQSLFQVDKEEYMEAPFSLKTTVSASSKSISADRTRKSAAIAHDAEKKLQNGSKEPLKKRAASSASEKIDRTWDRFLVRYLHADWSVFKDLLMHKNAKEYWFQKEVSGEPCLYLDLLKCSKYRKALIHSIKNCLKDNQENDNFFHLLMHKEHTSDNLPNTLFEIFFVTLCREKKMFPKFIKKIRTDSKWNSVFNHWFYLCFAHCFAKPHYFQFFDFFLELGLDINFTHEHIGGFTLVHFAAANENPQLIDKLITLNANMGALAVEKQSALHIAAGKGSLESLKLLLKCGLDVNSLDVDGRNPAHYAALSDTENLLILLKLHEFKVDLSLQDKLEQTPIYYAACYGKPLFLDYLYRKTNPDPYMIIELEICHINSILDKNKSVSQADLNSICIKKEPYIASDSIYTFLSKLMKLLCAKPLASRTNPAFFSSSNEKKDQDDEAKVSLVRLD